MGFLSGTDEAALTTGTVVNLADGRQVTIDPAAGESVTIGDHAVLTVVSVESVPAGERRCVSRFSPEAWVSIVETSEQVAPGTALKGARLGTDRLIVGGAPPTTV